MPSWSPIINIIKVIFLTFDNWKWGLKDGEQNFDSTWGKKGCSKIGSNSLIYPRKIITWGWLIIISGWPIIVSDWMIIISGWLGFISTPQVVWPPVHRGGGKGGILNWGRGAPTAKPAGGSFCNLAFWNMQCFVFSWQLSKRKYARSLCSPRQF